MKVILTLTIVLAAILGRVPLQAEGVWRPPLPIPNRCSEVRPILLLMDISGSMNETGRIERAKANASQYVVSDAPDCALAVMASFGITADVVGAEFLTGRESRLRFAELARHLSANHPYTNLDEAAKLIELLTFQLQSVYGERSADLSVRVYSDLISAPSIGKLQFSLQAFLTDRLAARHLRVTADSSPEEQRIRVVSSPPSVSDRNQEGTGAGSPRVLRRGVLPFLAGAGLLALGLALLVRLRLRPSRRPPLAGCLEGLLVTESTVQFDAETPEVLVADRRVTVAPGVPVVFSTDADSATYIAALVPGGTNGEIFRIEPLPDGAARIQSPHSRLTVNDEPLDVDRRLKVDIRQPIRVRLGPREFDIVGVFRRPSSFERADDVFDAEALQH